jgi:transcriptional/translational regulatory protein YebC/TACO1
MYVNMTNMAAMRYHDNVAAKSRQGYSIVMETVDGNKPRSMENVKKRVNKSVSRMPYYSLI